jgi:hypothetical protein
VQVVVYDEANDDVTREVVRHGTAEAAPPGVEPA